MQPATERPDLITGVAFTPLHLLGKAAAPGRCGGQAIPVQARWAHCAGNIELSESLLSGDCHSVLHREPQ